MDIFSTSRRGAMGFLASGAAAAALRISPAGAQAMRTRSNFKTWGVGFYLAALKNGVQVMKDRSAVSKDDPKGWYYWSAVHGTSDAVPPPLSHVYNQCKHGSPYFYPWHRAFLYYFEQVLREASGMPQLDLPYWNWYADPAIPTAFTTPANTSNPLWHPRANNGVGGLSQQFLGMSSFYPASSSMEADPHGAVHDQIGGDMGVIERSARDPIFWLHHCNVDRLWSVWNNRGYSNPPSGDPWNNERFTYDVGGRLTKTAGQVTSTSMLGYNYDQENNAVASRFFFQVALASMLVVKAGGAAQAAKDGAMTASAQSPGFALGAKSAQVKFELSGDARGKLQSFAAGTPAGVDEVELVLDGVQIAPAGRNGGYSFRVCVGVAAEGKVDSETLDKHCVGNIGLFQISVLREHLRHMGEADTGSYTMRFPLGAALKAAGAKALAQNVPVTFVAEHATLGTGKGNNTYVTVKSAHLEFARR